MKNILILLILFIASFASSQDELLSLHGFNDKSIICDTSDIGIHLRMPNDIITVTPVKLLDDYSMMWVIHSEIGNVIHTLGCECDVKYFLNMLRDYPITKKDTKEPELYYLNLVKTRWYGK